jgi:hypothetical protein
MKLTRLIMTSLAALVLLLLAGPLSAQIGKVHGAAIEGGESLPNYSIRLRANGAELRRSMTDANGKYEFALLPPGKYEVEVVEDSVSYRQPFELGPNETRPLDIDIASAVAYNANGERIVKLGTSTITTNRYATVPIFTVDPIQPQVVGIDDLNHLPGRGLDAAIPMFQGVYQRDAGDPLNINGSRSEATAIYVDNVKVRGDYQVPQSSISQIAVMNHGLPAEYGDATGGVIVISTYNPGMKSSSGLPISKAERKALRARQKSIPKGADIPAATDYLAHS